MNNLDTPQRTVRFKTCCYASLSDDDKQTLSLLTKVFRDKIKTKQPIPKTKAASMKQHRALIKTVLEFAKYNDEQLLKDYLEDKDNYDYAYILEQINDKFLIKKQVLLFANTNWESNSRLSIKKGITTKKKKLNRQISKAYKYGVIQGNILRGLKFLLKAMNSLHELQNSGINLYPGNDIARDSIEILNEQYHDIIDVASKIYKVFKQYILYKEEFSIAEQHQYLIAVRGFWKLKLFVESDVEHEAMIFKSKQADNNYNRYKRQIS